MPNWCQNNLSIKGDPEYIKLLADAATEGELFNTVVPIGPEWDYEKALNAWGTKWDIAEATVDIVKDDELSIVFDSAWSPPIGVYEALDADERIEYIYASYFEPGMNFGGEWEDGDDRFVENLMDSLRQQDPVAQELDEQWDFSSWFEEEEEELSVWLREGAEEKLQKGVDS